MLPYLTSHSPRPARTHPARADREKTPATIAGRQEHLRRPDDEPAKAAASCRLVKRTTPASARHCCKDARRTGDRRQRRAASRMESVRIRAARHMDHPFPGTSMQSTLCGLTHRAYRLGRAPSELRLAGRVRGCHVSGCPQYSQMFSELQDDFRENYKISLRCHQARLCGDGEADSLAAVA